MFKDLNKQAFKIDSVDSVDGADTEIITLLEEINEKLNFKEKVLEQFLDMLQQTEKFVSDSYVLRRYSEVSAEFNDLLNQEIALLELLSLQKEQSGFRAKPVAKTKQYN